MASATTDPNEVPQALDDTFTLDQDQTASLDVLLNDSDGDGDSVTLYSTSVPLHGDVEINNDQLVYTPDAGYYGDDSFTYTVTDGYSAFDTATVNLTINQVTVDNPPIAVDDNVEVLIGSTGNELDVLVNDSDPEGLPLSITSWTNGGKGTVQLAGDKLIYSTNSSKNRGGDSFTYTVSDGNSTSTATVNVSILRSLSDGGGDTGGNTGGGSGKCNPKKGCS
jgi:hypothetical protein